MNIIKKDADFFAKMGIIDYSMMIGVHDKELHKPPQKPKLTVDAVIHSQETSEAEDENQYGNGYGTASDIGQRNDSFIPNYYKKFYEQTDGGLISIDGKRIYYIGIIDIFTEFTAAKRAEYIIKSIQYEYGTASCVPPTQYANRFVDFMDKAL